MKLVFDTHIEAIEAMNADAMVSTRYAIEGLDPNQDQDQDLPFGGGGGGGGFLRKTQFGCSREQAQRLRFGQEVRVTIEVIETETEAGIGPRGAIVPVKAAKGTGSNIDPSQPQ